MVRLTVTYLDRVRVKTVYDTGSGHMVNGSFGLAMSSKLVLNRPWKPLTVCYSKLIVSQGYSFVCLPLLL
jgi:hypothetical protein